MVNKENQIDILINYKSNFAEALKDAETKVSDLSKAITDNQNRFKEIAKSRTKDANEERKLIKENLNNLQQELKVSSDILKSKKEANNYVSKGVMTQRNALDTMLKDTEKYNKRASDIIKNRLIKQADLEDSQINNMLKAQEALNNNIITENTKRFNAETSGNKKVVDDIISLRKQEQAQTMSIWRQETDAKIMSRKKELADMKQFMIEKARLEKSDKLKQEKADKNTFAGSFTSGSSFGHKFGTTIQYAAAGTAIFGVASALMAMGQAALEADLNMRTMSAVLNLNVEQAKQLDTQVRKLGETYGGTTAEIEQVAIALGRAGVKTKDITDATEVVLAMARLTGDTFEQSASAVISYQQVFGDTKNITELGNKLAYIANVSRLSTQDIGTFSNYALAAAKDVGLTEDAVGGLAAAFSNAGVNASTIGTQIRRFTTLLTESSTDVSNFFRGIGVNQANLLSDLQKGGETSNRALLDFVETLRAVDKSKFTSLTGQMDILAANSLQLMRNNSSNITKFVKELQTGVTNQLENTKVILESYIVTYESLWNKLKNIGADALNSKAMTFATTALSTSVSLISGNIDQAKNEAVAFQKTIADAALVETEKAFKSGLILQDEYLRRKTEYATRISELESMVGKTTVDTTKKTTAQQIAQLDILIKKQSSLLDSAKDTGAGETTTEEDKARLKVLRELVKERSALVVKEKEEAASRGVNPLAGSMELSKQLSVINTLIDAKKDYSKLEEVLNESIQSANKKNNEDILKQVDSIKLSGDAYASVNNIVTKSGTDSYKLLDSVSIRLAEINKQAAGKPLTPSQEKEVNVLTKIKEINNENIEALKIQDQLLVKKTNVSERVANSQEREANKLENIRQLSSGVAEARQKQLDLEELISEEGYTQISLAERKLNKAKEAEAFALNLLNSYKGNNEEERQKLLKDYEEKKLVSMEKQFDYNKKSKEIEIDRVNLMAEYKDNLDSSIASQEYRLGLVKDERLNEVEKLKLKVQQDLASKKINQEDADALLKQIALLENLSRKKKDIYAFTTEYQRQIDDQETVGYNAMKAGITSLESGMMNFFDVTSEGWLDWHALASDVLSSIYKQLLEQLIVKQLVSGITMGIGNMFAPTAPVGGSFGGVTSTAIASPSFTGNFSGTSPSGWNFYNGGMIPSKGYANGGVLSGGTGIRDDLYLGNVDGTRVFAMGGEFITRKSSVNSDTKGTLDYINKTGTTPNQGSQVNVPVKINIENQTGNAISADMIQQMTQTNDKGEYEKVVNIVLKASVSDPRIRSLLKGGR